MATKRPRLDAEDDPGPNSQVKKIEDISLELSHLTTETKRRRQDVAARRAANADKDVSVVKISLKSFCTEQSKMLPWEEVLKDMNKMVLEAYVLVNTHIVRLCHLRLPVEPLTQNFFHQFLSTVSSGRPLGNEHFRASVKLYNSWRAAGAPRASNRHIARGWQHNAALQMKTNSENAVKLNFYRRLHKQIKRSYYIDGSEVYLMLKSILDPVYDGDDVEILAWCARIPRKNNGYLDDKPHLLLPLTFMFLSDIEEWNLRNRETQGYEEICHFSLLPTKKGFECSHFTMCNLGLRALLKRVGIAVPNEDVWIAEADSWWRKLFRIEKFETVNRKFSGVIETDGKVVSIVLRKPKREIVATALDEKDYDVLWGLDPGRRDLFVATNQFGEKIFCTTREFYGDAHYKKSNQKTMVWQENRPDVLEAVRNMPTKKTASLEQLEAYVKFMTPRMDLLLDFRMHKPFRKLRFRRYILAKKKLRQLCQRLTAQAGRRTVVGFGDWSNTDVSGLIKKCPAGPVNSFRRELKKHCRVETIDEFRTSKLHSVCHCEMKNQYSKRLCKKDGVERTLKVHSVLHCTNNGCHGMTVNRDENALKNMLMLLIECKLCGQPRPLAFSRPRT
ncbi:hypothetical protein F443_01870 [Phytophthora nicotianae P1569]|uniref:Uncharacterized protein n=1 Tax=Phytophthora nicotianae P1569 TaxID=1317065 RepID=V9FXG4_PHYNI|nr:hypothetical protein F443_01870 [Phytophthora nicotianae P1569]